PDDHLLVSDETETVNTHSAGRVTVPESAMKENLLHEVRPEIPQDASDNNGTVLLQATVGRDGTVRSARVVDGDPALGKAATRAVMQWRYKPYVVDGQTADVDTQIRVQFKPGDEQSSR